jgi:hypothetical protein
MQPFRFLLALAITLPVSSFAGVCVLELRSLLPHMEYAGAVGQHQRIGAIESKTESTWVPSQEQNWKGEACYSAARGWAKKTGFPKFVDWTILDQGEIDAKGSVDLGSPATYEEGDQRLHRPGMNNPENCVYCYWFYYDTKGFLTNYRDAEIRLARSGMECKILSALALRKQPASIQSAKAIWGEGLNLFWWRWDEAEIRR